MSEPSTGPGRMEEIDEDSVTSFPQTNKTQDSVENLVVRMKFARETAMLTMPTWQSAAHQHGQSVLKILDQIISVLSRATDHLTIGVLNSDGNIQPRVTPMVYFAGLLISNFHPGASEVNETFGRMDVLFSSIENETIKLLKTLKKFDTGFRTFTKSLVDELHHPMYLALPENDGKNDNQSNADLFQRSMFKKYSLHNFPGIWLELINLERENLYLQIQRPSPDGGSGHSSHLTRIPADDLQLEVAVKLGSLLLAEIQETVQKTSNELSEIQLTTENLKGWKKTSSDLANYLKHIRKVHEFSSYNCARELSSELIEIRWKMDVVIYNQTRVLKNACIWILKGIECVRRKSRIWSPDHVILSTPQVMKYISSPRPRISKFFPCIQPRSQENPIDFVRMFLDIGNVIGESFLLEVAISQTMAEILFEGNLGSRQEDASNESLPVHFESVASEEPIMVESEKSMEIDANEVTVAGKLNSATGSRGHTPSGSEPISRKESPVEMGFLLPISSCTSDSEDIQLTDTEEKITLTGIGFDDDGESICSNHLPENPGKSSDPWAPSEGNQEGDPSNSPASPDGSKSATTTTGEESPRKIRFYWARRLIERMSPNPNK